MYHESFEPPTNHYDESIQDIDEQICQLIRERKERTHNNPGFPPHKLISSWAKTYHLYEEFLQSLFSEMYHEEHHKPVVEPKGFRKNIPILKTYEKDNDLFYSMTIMRQFKNASVVFLNTDGLAPTETLHPHDFHIPHRLELSIVGDDQTYDCRWQGGSGSDNHLSNTYVVSPPLPDEESGLKLVFTEFKTHEKNKPTGFEFVINY
ncbi:hypothetical protein [Alkalicoccobacillus murimartini]|uniref:Uncharacterized protein n=1 Tax=Alkalicoccobacillus murimartini TaxID=171685 RepID=A0ABT9YIW1_9BACI|nr:hypothetical protein [Alkalicoccobacillus murimartini]MDQ0207420.1 hypothetical protein [Alkalicoccobacillus murimartini]